MNEQLTAQPFQAEQLEQSKSAQNEKKFYFVSFLSDLFWNSCQPVSTNLHSSLEIKRFRVDASLFYLTPPLTHWGPGSGSQLKGKIRHSVPIGCLADRLH